MMRIARPSPADLERRARAAARQRRRDETVAVGALRRARGSEIAAAAALRNEAAGYRTEANWLSSKGVDGGLGAWRAAERRDRAADLFDPGGGAGRSSAATAFFRGCRATALVNLELTPGAYRPALTKPCSAPRTDPPA